MTTKSISMYLLKPGIEISRALRDDHGYEEVKVAGLQESYMRVFLKPGMQNPPWWKEYLGITEAVFQQSSSAVAFVNHGEHTVALTFGASQHSLRDDAYAHDFGTRVVLNAVDPRRLKSADTLNPDSSQRRRTQIPFDGDLALLSFAGDSAVLKSLTGKARAEHRDLVGSVTGATSLRVTSPASADQLLELLERLLNLYESEAYLTTFPDVALIRPITDPATIEPLNARLVEAVFDASSPLVLTVPDILDYEDEAFVQFAGRGPSEVFEDVYIKHYREYLELKGMTPASMTIEGLKHDDLVLLDGNMQAKRRWSIFRSLIFETQADDGYSYHLSDGTWYRVASRLIDSLSEFLDPHWIDANLPTHEWANEGEFNTHASAQVAGICLDKTNISPPGQTAVEPCDILRLGNDEMEFVHVKIGTSSATLSHLFNQATNSLELLRTNEAAEEKLVELVREREGDLAADQVVDLLKANAISVSMAIVSHKQTPERKSKNLPLFSRISLRRSITALKAMRVTATVQLVPDTTDRAGKKKPSKVRGTVARP